MAITDDIRKAATDPTPLYFLAGTADLAVEQARNCLLYTSPSPRDGLLSRMPSSA